MIADDEGIVIDALKFIIEKNFGTSCMVESAKSGRDVIELAERFRPDIAFMDIQMPGINGIEAMKEIRRENANTIFIVVSAYDKFDYAKEAINLGVLEYVNKPIEQTHIVELLKRSMKMVDEEREKRSKDLAIREKLEIVVPFIENGFIYSVLFQENYAEDIENFKRLLGIEQEIGFMMVLECGEAAQNGHFTNPIGTSVRVQSIYPDLRAIIKDYYPDAAVGSMMANKIIIFIPASIPEPEAEYEARIALIDRTREMVRKLRKKVDVYFRVGIGYPTKLEEIEESYKEALKSLKYAQGSVVHVKDLSLTTEYEDNYPIENERRLFEKVEEGDVNAAYIEARNFFSWMVEHYAGYDMDIRLKTMEFVLWAEKIAYLSGGMLYRFTARHEYLDTINNIKDYEELRVWFLDKIAEACRNIAGKKQESSMSIVQMAKEYIKENFAKDISLDEVSREVNISPYYFSKVFKEEAGINFIDYLTEIRMEQAKKLLQQKNLSMKEICVAVGYGDPNYFSRTFKKNVGVTPTEYKEGKIENVD